LSLKGKRKRAAEKLILNKHSSFGKEKIWVATVYQYMFDKKAR
jgi:hypothetical protein